ncbi:MAG: NUDIX domain-containing protein [Crocinitomicaceae bacterium]|nr:NUDIX domain-containing protein [Crocinitomicaceae bacterium]
MAITKFNIRVYGILINDKQEVLISDEHRFKTAFTKFPGGGLEFGEGLADGLKREFREELNLEIEVGELFYVNDFLQTSKFDDSYQLISFYYLVNCADYKSIKNRTSNSPLTADGEEFRWFPIEKLRKEMMTFPIDKLVAEKLGKANQ